MKITQDDGKEIEVYTAEELQVKVTEGVNAEVDKVKKEFEPLKTTLEKELADAKKALGERASEFGQFRKLNEETIAKLSVAERQLYENQKFMAEDAEKRKKSDSDALAARVDVSLRSKAGKDDKLFNRMKEVWGIINIDAVTPEDIEKKTMMVLGSLRTTEPDIVASVAGFGGSGGFEPPKPIGSEEKSYGDTDTGKAAAAALGLLTEAPKKKE